VRFLFLSIVFIPISLAGDGLDGRLDLYGDIRFRLERDWDSRRADGTQRDDRDRFRGRIRFGWVYRLAEHYRFGGRLRSGDPDAQQSPHVTFGDGFDAADVGIDRLFLQADIGAWRVWAGKNSLPFWKPNELYWDDDVQPEGIAAIYASGPLRVGGGYFTVDDGPVSNDLSDKADLFALQLSGKGGLGSITWQAGLGYLGISDNPDTVNPTILDLDWRVLVASMRIGLQGTRFILDLDLIHNAEDYPVDQLNREERDGHVITLRWGDLSQAGHWDLRYYWAHIEKLAVVPYFAQDDWLRWGSGGQTRSSNFEGHEFRAAYALTAAMNLTLRLYLVEGITGESPTAATLEDGNRIRLDWNARF